MSRPIRIEYDNAFYHVMSRGKGRQKIFHGDDYYHAFFQCLQEAHERFSLQVHSYCLMGNHYHLLLKTPKGNLSRAMRHVNGIYTQRYNRLKKTDGSLFRGRYKAILIDADSHLLEVSRYIHRNPIETRTPIVNNLEDYIWSSYPQYMSKSAKCPDWLCRDEMLGMMGGRSTYKSYKKFVSIGNSKEIEKFYDLKHTPAMMGDQEFKEKVLAGVDFSPECSVRSAREAVEVEVILDAVITMFACERSGLLKVSRGRQPRNYARWVAMKLCQSHGQMTLQKIADIFGVTHYSTISQTIGRLNRAMVEDDRLFERFGVISQDLTP
ncbi:MAG: hypothetical protein COA42_17685 [Alteromonadaceae bacterium]|nr:MAG: hypothetical protein COA42_17685 [Alteromonadaceae bacterium]